MAQTNKLKPFGDGVLQRDVSILGKRCRILEKGDGDPIGYLGGFGGVPRWTPFLDLLSRTRRVIVPSLPGFPGGEGHKALDDQLDWLIATHELLVKSGLEGRDLIGVSVGGALAADVAAVWPDSVRRLILLAPFGLFDEMDPTADLWAQRPSALPGILCARPDQYREYVEDPQDDDPLEWDIMLTRASEAAVRYLYPFGETGLRKRLHRIRQPVLLLQGSGDKVMPRSQLDIMRREIPGPCALRVVEAAGHLADLDDPAAVFGFVDEFLNGARL